MDKVYRAVESENFLIVAIFRIKNNRFLVSKKGIQSPIFADICCIFFAKRSMLLEQRIPPLTNNLLPALCARYTETFLIFLESCQNHKIGEIREKFVKNTCIDDGFIVL